MTDQYPSLPPYGPGPPPSAQTPPPAPVRPHRTRRLLATVTATALVVGVGGFGAGYAIGHGFSGSTQTASGTTGRSNVSTDGSGGITTSPGNGGPRSPWPASSSAGSRRCRCARASSGPRPTSGRRSGADRPLQLPRRVTDGTT